MTDRADEGVRELRRRLSEAGDRIEPVLRELFPPEQDDCLSGPFWHHMRAGGKRLRPALCLLCCEALGGRAELALHFAAAVEILHNMFLVHDDIEDGDTVRRDAPAVWVKFGVGNAVNVGDYMLGRAYSTILRSPVDAPTRLRLLETFTDTYERTCRGQALDMSCRGQETLTLDQYLEMVRLKTGHYLVLGMVGGAIVAGAGEGVVRRLKDLGAHMGPAFQMRDDVIDLTEGKGRGGVVGNDVREGKPSILYAHALSAAAPADARRLVEIMRKDRGGTTDDDVGWVVSLYGRLGSVEFAKVQADGLIAKAFEIIEGLAVAGKQFFRNVALYMANRTS